MPDFVKPCIKCGATDRYKSGRCKPCQRKANRKWYAANKERHIENGRQWAARNPERRREIDRRYKKANTEKLRQRARERYWADPEKGREIGRRWAAAHRGKHNANSRRWRMEHPGKAKKAVRRWLEANPGKMREFNQNRRARLSEADGTVSDYEWQAIVRHYGGRCLCCGNKEADLTMDHIIPLARGGVHKASNIQPLCLSCNSKKGTKVIDYRPDTGPMRWKQARLLEAHV